MKPKTEATPLLQRDDTDYREAAKQMIEVFLGRTINQLKAERFDSPIEHDKTYTIEFSRAKQNTLKALALLRDNALPDHLIEYVGSYAKDLKSKEYFERLIIEVENFEI